MLSKNHYSMNDWVWLSGILLLGAFLRFYGLLWDLPFIYYTDEAVLVNRALAFGLGDFNPHFFYYPAFYMYLLFFAYGFIYIGGYATGIFASTNDMIDLYFNDPTIFFATGRFLNALASIFCIVIVYYLGRKYYGHIAAIFSSAVLTLAPITVLSSHYSKVHLVATFFLAVSLIFQFSGIATKSLKSILIGAFFVGLAAATSYHTGLAIVSVLVAEYLRLGKLQYKQIIVGSILIGFVSFMGFFLGAPYSVLDFKMFYKTFYASAHTIVDTYLYTNSWDQPLRAILTGIGLPLSLLLCLSLITQLFRRDKIQIVLWIHVLSVLFFLMNISLKMAHHSIIIYPAASLLIGIMIQDIVKWSQSLNNIGKWVYIGFLILSSASLLYSGYNNYGILRTLKLKDTRTTVREWVLKNIPEGTKLLVESGKYYLTFRGPDLPLSQETYDMIIQRESIDEQQNPFVWKGNRQISHKGSTRFFEMKRKYEKTQGYTIYQIIHSGKIDIVYVNDLQYYLEKGVQYAIINRHCESNYQIGTALERSNPVGATIYRTLYQDIRKTGTLVASFDKNDNEKGFSFDIYKF
ncbi:glycosyltransferase family 39 protein [bacterium]|nr:glycosyltransferase family 39 protein [bacterium]